MNEKISKAVNDAINDVFKPQDAPKLIEIVKQPDFSFSDLSESSLKFVEFCMQVEESLGIEIEFNDLMEHNSYLGFIGWLNAQAGPK